MKKNLSLLLSLFFSFTLNISFGQGDWKNILKDDVYTDLVFQTDGVWTATDGNGLEHFCYDGNFNFGLHQADGLPSDVVRAISQNESEEIWIATNQGIAFYDNANWTVFNEANSMLLSNDVIDIQVQKNGRIWIGFENAIQNFSPQSNTWEVYDNSTLDIFPDSTFINFEVDADDVVWAAFPHRLLKFEIFPKRYSLPTKYVHIIGNFSEHRDTIYTEVNFISRDSDGTIRVNNNYDTWIDETDQNIYFGHHRDIAGVIHNVSRRNYWWAYNSSIANAIYYPSTDLNNCLNPDEINWYGNEAMSISPDLNKAPLRFSPVGNLWIIHENGISILGESTVALECKKIEDSNTTKPDSDAFSVFPNPNQGVFSILEKKATTTHPITIKIFSANGNLVFEKSLTESKTDILLPNLKHGVYYIHLYLEDSTLTKRVSIF